ncbi:hypothetical protein H9649_03600 [Sporosarcina sp. Sa2YVA2]|uniref:Sigma-X negative effector n=1 Tax=Sporosarcina quadrami TaxID=2762234 RepID=A0ABR8U6L5_9BACL|nr:hypothetical protein [Sporosarcina quadrami]MBD7983658.1 hypothetical protein [Sporosarcina quadrami]
MPDNKWSDDDIESLLQSMPRATDNRSAENILKQLKNDERLKTNPSPKRMKRWIPGLVAIAAVFVLMLIVPSMLNGNKSEMDIGSEPAMIRSIDSAKMQLPESEHSQNITEEESMDMASYSAKAFAPSHVVLSDEFQERQLFHIGLVHEATVIPLTFIMPIETLEKDFPDGVHSSSDLYNQYANALSEEEFGFDDYHPYKGSIRESEGVIIHELGNDYLYDNSSASIEVYMNSAIATFSSDHSNFETVDAKGDAIIFDHVGSPMKFNLRRQAPYFKYVMDDGQSYLIPYENGFIDNAVDALLAMRQSENDVVEEVVPTGVDYTVKDENGILMLTFTDTLDFAQMNGEEVNEMLEGFMLTAANFDCVVQLRNIVQDHFLKYDLTKPLPKPIGANPVHWN